MCWQHAGQDCLVAGHWTKGQNAGLSRTIRDMLSPFTHVIAWLKFTYMMVIISIVVHKVISTDISRLVNFTDRNILPCQAYFVLSTFVKFTENVSVSIRTVINIFIRHVTYFPRINRLDGNLVTDQFIKLGRWVWCMVGMFQFSPNCVIL
jgi:hypothetical protein